MTDIIVDLANLFSRARYGVRGSLDDKVGLSVQTCLSSIRKAWRDFGGSHVIICLEGRSWRRGVYSPYKNNRDVAKSALSPSEAEEDKVFWETFTKLSEFFINKTNCSVLQHPNLEADDLIGGWIQHHPERHHVINSTDGDFDQLISPTVRKYNGISDITTAHDGYFDEKGKRVIDKKTKEVKPPPEPRWQLFEKCMRGDSSDNIFSAYPNVREKSTKNKIGLRDAFLDMDTKGYNWNNMMLQRFMHHDGTEHLVMDDYNRNVLLCDLTAQPPEVRQYITDTIVAEIASDKQVGQVGVRLLKFCAEFDLVRVSEQATSYAEPLNARYNK